MKIRPATLDDLAVLVDFNARLAFESEQLRLDPDALTLGCHAVLAHPERGFYTLAERDGEVIGQCLVTHEWSDWRAGWLWWIGSVYVVVSARRTGVWSTLHRHLVARARARGDVVGLRLYVERANRIARATYEKLGMTDAGYDVMELLPLAD